MLEVSWIVLGIVALAALILGTVAFIASAPSQYNVYDSNLITEHESAAENESNVASTENGCDNEATIKIRTLRASVSVQVVVLGDIGRSPRMQYHAISLAKHGARVDLIGFVESEIHPDLRASSLVSVVPLSVPPRFLHTSNKFFFALLAPIKVVWQACDLYYILGYGTKPAKWMLVQNPPSIPLLAIAKIICFHRNTRLVVDWHNYGWTVLAVKLGAAHPLVTLSRWYENIFGRSADAHIAVTNAMSKSLKDWCGVKAPALHDRPMNTFRALNAIERSAVLDRLPETAQYAQDIKTGSWRLVISSTSWTPDEDFSLLLNGLVKYSEQGLQNTALPKLLVIITGKGPQKEYYLRKIGELNQSDRLSRAVVVTAWLSTEDYALLLGAADLGISLHKSTSGVDLPMKIVDMFGSGLPVVGWSGFAAWSELVKEGVNGRGFTTASELAVLLEELFNDGGTSLKSLKQGALDEGALRWDGQWDTVAGKLFQVVKANRSPSLLQ